MKNKSFIKYIFATALTIFTLAGTFIGTTAWYVSTTKLDDVKIDGRSAGAYFAYGNGESLTYDEENHNRPYGITLPRHLYNLAWLHYMGEFDDQQYYFELAADIDMSGYVLPPIGTTKYPFVSHFNGNGHVISGLTVSADESELFSSNYHPDRTTVDYQAPEIVGLFGVVGNLNDGSGAYSYAGSYESSANEVEDLIIDNIVIKSSTTKALVGMVAGYVDGTISNVIVDNSSLNIAENTTTAVNSTSFTDKISDFGVVGYATDSHKYSFKEVDHKVYQITTDTDTFVADTSGKTSEWGGSIDMKSVHDRLNDIRKNYAVYKDTFYTAYTNHHDVNGDLSSSSRTANSDSYDTRRLYTPTYTGRNGSYNEKIGAFNFWHNDSGTGSGYAQDTSDQVFHYMAGGHTVRNYYDQYREHTGKRITDGTNYLNVSRLTTNNNSNNAGTINNLTKNGNNEPNATVWSLPNSSGYISTTYYYNNGNSTTTYYLYNYQGNLRLGCGNNYRTTWTKVTLNGKVTYTSTYNNNTYYIRFNGTNWVLTRLETEPVYTWDNENPEPQTLENWLQSHPEPVLSDYTLNANDTTKFLANSYQIYVISNNVKYFLKLTSTTAFTTVSGIENLGSSSGFAISNFASGEENSTIRGDASSPYTQVSNYLYAYGTYNGASLRYGNTNSSWRITSVGNNQYRVEKANVRYSYDWSSGYVTATHYLTTTGNANTFTISRTSSTVYIDTTANLVNEYNALAPDRLESDHTSWVTERDRIDKAHKDWVKDRDEAVEDFNNRYDEWENATYTLNNTSNTTTSGFDIQSDATSTSDDEYFCVYNGERIYDTSYFPINSNSATDVAKDNTLTLYEPTDNNTGYFVGGGVSGNTRFGRHKISSYLSTNSYQNNKFKAVRTYDGTDKNITADYASSHFEKYDKTIEKLETIMKNQTYVYGMHFRDATISLNHLAVAKWASINNVSKSEYDLVANSVDFNLKEPGLINFVAGTYGNYSGSSRDTDVDSFFSLHIVIRDANDKIINIKEIAEIYTDGVSGHAYIYKLTDGTYTTPYAYDPTNRTRLLKIDQNGNTTNTTLNFNEQYLTSGTLHTKYDPNGSNANAKCLFKTEWLKKTGFSDYGEGNSKYYTPKYAYYFEIKVNEGEYALGSVEGGYFGAYLMYLDIGASALSLSRTSIYEHFRQSLVTFVYPEGIALKDKNDATAFSQRDTFLVTIETGFHGVIYIDRNADGDDVRVDGTGTKASVTYAYKERIETIHNGDDDTISLDVTAVVTDEYRLRYIDFNANTGAAVETVIEETFIDNVSQGRTYEQHNTDGTESDFGVYNSTENGATVDEDGNVADIPSGAALNDIQIASIDIKRAAEGTIVRYNFEIYSDENISSYSYVWEITYDDLINGPTFEDEVTGYTITITPVGGTVNLYILEINRTNACAEGDTYVIVVNGNTITAIYPTQQAIPANPANP